MISEKAIEAAAKALEQEYLFAYGKDLGGKVAHIMAHMALTAALPHLSPAPSQSDEEWEMSERLTDEQLRCEADNLPKGGIWQNISAELVALRAENRRLRGVFAAALAAARAEERELTKRDLVANTETFVREAIRGRQP